MSDTDKTKLGGIVDEFSDTDTEAGVTAEDDKNDTEAGVTAEDESNEDNAEAGVTAEDDKNDTEAGVSPSVEPSLNEQIDEQDKISLRTRKMRNEVFNKTGLKVNNNDPVIELVLAIRNMAEEEVELILNNLESTSENIIDNILAEQKQIDKKFKVKTDEFDKNFGSKLNELNHILSKLEDQKEAIVMDVWNKLDQRVMDKIQTELTKSISAIAQNSNNKINNERMLLKGGVGGLVAGIFLCAILLFIFL